MGSADGQAGAKAQEGTEVAEIEANVLKGVQGEIEGKQNVEETNC